MTDRARRRKISKTMERVWAARLPEEKTQALRGIRGLKNLVPRRCRNMAPIERAWLGAFIEADGSAGVAIHKWPPRKCVYSYPQIMITQRGVDPIATALRVTQCGSVSFSSQGQWVWTPSSIADTLAVARQCAPYSWKLQKLLSIVADRGEWGHEEVLNDD